MPGFRVMFRIYQNALRVLAYTPPILATCFGALIVWSPLIPINSDMQIILLIGLIGMGALGLFARFGEPTQREVYAALILYCYLAILMVSLGLYTDQFRTPQRPVTPVKGNIIAEIVIRGVATALAGLVVGGILPFGSFVFKKLMPAKICMPDVVFDFFESKYKRVILIINAVSVVIAVGLAILWFWGLQTCTSYRLSGPDVLAFERGPDKAALLIASLFCGLMMATLLVDGAIRLCVSKRYWEIDLYSRAQFERLHGLDATAMTVLFLILFSIHGIGLSVIEADSYVGFTEREIVINPTWGFGERRYRYDDVKAIWQVSHRRSRKGKIVVRHRHVLEFTDGFIWTTRDNPGYAETEKAEESALIRFVSERSGMPVRQTKFHPHD